MLLQLDNLVKHFAVRGPGLFGRGKGLVRAVDGVSFGVREGETFALVGESGCGKTTIAKLVLLLETPTSGSLSFAGEDLKGRRGAALKGYRRQVQAVFQDPYSSLNGRMRVGGILAEPLRAHHILEGAALGQRIAELLEIVSLPAGSERLYPHEFSGGQRQRIAIARALALNPPFIVLDEPTSALDVSIRAQILNLLTDIQEQFGLTYLIIAHDLALVEHISHRVGVMYLGHLVETGTTEQVFGEPRHPYTQALLASVPRPDPEHRLATDAITGEIGSALNPPSGCRFHPRCPYAEPTCQQIAPRLQSTAGEHQVACHLVHPPRTAAAPHRPPSDVLTPALRRDTP